MTLFGQVFYNLGSNEAAASNHNDLHFASPFVLRLRLQFMDLIPIRNFIKHLA